MAERESVYESSIARYRSASIALVVVVGFFLLESLYGIIMHHSNPMVWYQSGIRVVTSTILLGGLFFATYTNSGRSLRVSPRQVVFRERSGTYSIPMTQLIVRVPKEIGKRASSMVLTDGTHVFRVDAAFFPGFEELAAELKKYKTSGAGGPSVYHTKTGGY